MVLLLKVVHYYWGFLLALDECGDMKLSMRGSCPLVRRQVEAGVMQLRTSSRTGRPDPSRPQGAACGIQSTRTIAPSTPTWTDKVPSGVNFVYIGDPLSQRVYNIF